MDNPNRYFIIYKPYKMVSQFVSPDKVNLLGNLDFDFPEGIHAIGRLDNNSEIIGDKLILKEAELIAESYSICSINANANLSIDASGSSEIKIYGEQKIEIKRLLDSATLIKKPTK